MNGFQTIAAGTIGALLLSTAAFGQFGQPQQQQRPLSADQLVSLQLAADITAMRPGEKFDLVLLFEIRPAWHIYWKNPGEGAAPPNVILTVPEGFKVDEARWPRPKQLDGEFGEVYAYETEAAIFFPVTVPDDFDGSSATFIAEIAYAVCDDRICLFGDVTRRLTLSPLSEGAERRDPPYARAITRQRDRLPRPIDRVDGGSAELRNDGRELVVVGPVLDSDTLAFYPFDSPGVRYGEAEIKVADDRFVATIPLEINPRNFTDGPPPVGGLIVFGKNHHGPSYEITLALPSGGS